MAKSLRDIVVRFKVTEEERIRLETEARKLGLSVSAFLRMIFTKYKGVHIESKPKS